MIQITLPSDVKFIIEKLEAAGFEAYAVGGCVRDQIMGREPNDWDITTSATPYEVKDIFHKTVDTGLVHGTVTVILHGEGYEVTTYRIDGEYEDGRHPKQVSFTASLEEDLKRRDFTINAMAYNESHGLVDLFGGLEDLEKGVIRCVGEPMERFSEDALRMMRAVRFSAQFGYEIEEATREAVRKLAPTLEKVSVERIQVELTKLLTSGHPDFFRECYELGLTELFMPEFDACMTCEQHNPHHAYTVGEHTLIGMQHVPADKVLRLTMLLHDIGKVETKTTDEAGIDHFRGHPVKSAEMAKVILRRLRYDNQTIHDVVRLVEFHDWDIHIEARKKSVRKAVAKIGQDFFPEMFEINLADTLAQSDYLRKEKLEKLDALKALYQEILRDKECLTLKDLAVNGQDLMAAGVQPGKQIGQILNAMLQDVLEYPEHNDKEHLLQRVKEFSEGATSEV
ncbi:MAG: CCA tRNA nucleotidyltransferase [Lachnospiraceae bacterium]|nr:CCA tRNA nucleotidyltransferase [Lachnospiraceae bacterium]